MIISNKFLKLKWLTMALVLLVSFSCSKSSKDTGSPDNNTQQDDDDDVVPSITAISISNAGANGDQTVDGTVDEDAKSISFTSIDPETDLSSVKFNATITPDGAKLEKDSYDFGFDAGDTKKTIAIKVKNGSMSKEYLVTIKLAVVADGADFDKVTLYDHSNAATIYPDFNGTLVRGSAFDGTDVLIVSRDPNGPGPHLLAFDDLKAGTVNPITLDLTGVAGGTYTYNAGAQINGHTYITTLAGGAGSPFKIYHWTDPNNAPDVLYDEITSVFNAPEDNRFGDYMSASLDENGDGYMYFGGRDPANHGFGRLTVSNYTNISDPTYYEYPDASYQVLTFMISVNQVGNTDKYIETGYDATIYVTDATGNPANAAFTLAPGTVPDALSDARVITFNKKRYLIGMTTFRHEAGETTFYVYDITKGDNVVEALQNFENADSHDPVYKYSLQGAKTLAPGTRTDYHIIKDGDGKDKTLLLYAAGTDVGFTIFEVPKAE